MHPLWLSLALAGSYFIMADSEASTGNATQQIRLYSKAKIMSYQRSHKYQKKSCSLLNIEGVTSKEDTEVRCMPSLELICVVSRHRSNH